MKDLSITSKRIIVTEMSVPSEGGPVTRQVEVVLRTPTTPQSMRIMLANSMMQTAHEVFVATLEEAGLIQDKFYDEDVNEDGKKIKVRKKITVSEAQKLMDEAEACKLNVDAAERVLDVKRREFHRSCFSFVESIRSLENKHDVMFDFGWADGKLRSWSEMSDDDKETLCDYDTTLAITPIFEVLRSGASAEELGK